MNEFTRETILKAIYTMAETALGFMGTATLLSEIHWGALVSTVLLAGMVTVLKCIIIDLPKYVGADELTDEEVEMYDDLEQR